MSDRDDYCCLYLYCLCFQIMKGYAVLTLMLALWRASLAVDLSQNSSARSLLEQCEATLHTLVCYCPLISLFTLHILESSCPPVFLTVHTSHPRVQLSSCLSHCSHFTSSSSTVLLSFSLFTLHILESNCPPVYLTVHTSRPRILLPSRLSSVIRHTAMFYCKS